MSESPVLEFIGARRRWRPSPLGTPSGEAFELGPISLQLHTGELLAVVGPAGCGKSTLLLLAAGQLPCSAGSARWAGSPDPAVVRPQVTAARPWEYGFLTVRQALAFHADVLALRDAALPAPTRYVPLMRRVGLRGMSRVRLGALAPLDQLRVVLAQALLAHPRLIGVEEPFAYCSPVERREGIALLQQLALSGLAIIVTGRSPEDCGGQGTADRVVMLRAGQMLNAEPARRAVLELAVPSAEEAMRRLGSRLPSIVRRGRRVRVPLRGTSPEAVLALCRAVGVEVRGSRVAEELVDRSARHRHAASTAPLPQQEPSP